LRQIALLECKVALLLAFALLLKRILDALEGQHVVFVENVTVRRVEVER